MSATARLSQRKLTWFSSGLRVEVKGEGVCVERRGGVEESVDGRVVAVCRAGGCLSPSPRILGLSCAAPRVLRCHVRVTRAVYLGM